jgi:hypothetical protein
MPQGAPAPWVQRLRACASSGDNQAAALIVNHVDNGILDQLLLICHNL